MKTMTVYIVMYQDAHDEGVHAVYTEKGKAEDEALRKYEEEDGYWYWVKTMPVLE